MKIKTRKFKIRIRTLDESLDNFEKAFMEAPHRKESKVKSEELVLGFETFSLLSKIISPERLRILKVLREKKPESVAALAQMLGRAQANVHKDVHFLADLGILTLRQSKSRKSGKAPIKPSFDWDGFDIAM